jgi:predicted nucleic acid-binding protein
MLLLLDTNVLLRLVVTKHPDHAEVASAVRVLRRVGHTFAMAMQGASEFWNVCTRPVAARGGLGLSLAQTDTYLGQLERQIAVRTDSTPSFAIWRQLIVRHGVRGVQVHDARIAALMLANGISHILTYNGKDFTRFPGISALSPADVVAGNIPPP